MTDIWLSLILGAIVIIGLIVFTCRPPAAPSATKAAQAAAEKAAAEKAAAEKAAAEKAAEQAVAEAAVAEAAATKAAAEKAAAEKAAADNVAAEKAAAEKAAAVKAAAEKAAATKAAAVKAAYSNLLGSMLDIGRRVAVIGLDSRSDLNGSVGKIVCWHAASGRWGIQLDSSALRVRPVNLALANSRVSVLETPDLLSHVLELVLTLKQLGSTDIVMAAAVCKRWAAAATSLCMYSPALMFEQRPATLVKRLRSFGPTSKGLAVFMIIRLYTCLAREIRSGNGNFTQPAQRELLALDVLPAVLSVLHAHPTSKGVQAHGLTLLSLFVKARDAPAIGAKQLLIAQGTVGVVVRAMRTHPLVAVSPALFARDADDGWEPKLQRSATALQAVPLLARAIRNVVDCDLRPLTDSQCYNILVEGVKAYGAILYATLPAMPTDEADTSTADAASLLLQV
jgi:hypothetical protein